MAQIFLTVDRSTLTFDEKLQGKICLSLTEDKSDLTPLCLQIVGKEIHFRRHYLESGQGKGKELLSTKTFLDFTFPVIEFPTNHTLSAGKYEFPFEFSFPEGLPASLRLTSPPTDETFSINYLASAHFLNQATPAPAAMEIWMKASQAAAAALRIPKGWNEYSTPLELPFSYLCCSSGSVRLALQLPRIIVTGKPFDLYYSIENLSKTSDFDVEFALWADLKPKSRMTTLQSVEQVKLFKTKKIPSSQLKVRYQSSRPSSTVKGVEASEIMDSAVLGEMKEGLNQPDHLLRIILPERYALPGNVIAFGHKGLKEVNYYITFHLTMSGQSEPLKVRAPVTLIQNQSNDAPNKTLTSSASTASNPLLPLFSQPLPEDWTATQTYAVAAVPTPCYSEPVTSFTSKDFSSAAAGEARKFSIAPTSTLTPAGQVSGKVPNISYEGGFADLIYALKLSFQQHRTFLAFLQHSPANAQEIEECSAHDFTMLFQSIRASVDQLLIAEEVTKVKSAISMEHILAAIAACNAEVKIGLAQILATRYTSTGRPDDVLPLQRQCSTYEYLCIEEYYANGRGTVAGAGKAVGKTVGGGSYDTVQSKDDVALTIGAESTEDGMNILKNQSMSMSMSMSGSMDFDHDHMIQHFDSIQVSRI